MPLKVVVEFMINHEDDDVQPVRCSNGKKETSFATKEKKKPTRQVTQPTKTHLFKDAWSPYLNVVTKTVSAALRLTHLVYASGPTRDGITSKGTSEIRWCG